MQVEEITNLAVGKSFAIQLTMNNYQDWAVTKTWGNLRFIEYLDPHLTFTWEVSKPPPYIHSQNHIFLPLHNK